MIEVSVARVPCIGEEFEVVSSDRQRIIVSGRVQDVKSGVVLAEGGGTSDGWYYVTLTGWRGHDYTSEHNKVQP